MKFGSKRLFFAAAGTMVVWLVGVALAASGTKGATPVPVSQQVWKTGQSVPLPRFAHPLTLASGQAGAAAPARGQAAPARGQAAPAPVRQTTTEAGAEMSEVAFKNVTALTGIPVDEFMDTMGIFSAALSMCCAECHTGAGTDTVKWELDTPRKITGRRMVKMVQQINKDNFGGRQVVTCWSCHRGRDKPVTTPSIDTIYGTPTLEPDDILVRAPTGPTPAQVIDKYIAAIGGAAKVAALTSYTAKGNSVGFGGFSGARPVEIYAKFPNQRATFIHTDDGDISRTYDGTAGWIATPLTAIKLFPLVSAELDGAKFDAQIAFPQQLKTILTNPRTSFSSTINDKEVEVVQGNGTRGLLVTLSFDKQTGLLVRMVRHANSMIGRVPYQLDFADYREVAGTGVKIPYKWIYAWVDGRDTFDITSVQANGAIDAAKFGKPAPPTPKK